MNKRYLIVATPYVLSCLFFGMDGLECMALLTAPLLVPIFWWMEDLI